MADDGAHPHRVIATIGYEGLPPDDFIGILRGAGIARVVDVRALANSRRPGYAKRALSAKLAESGIAYEHMPALGTPAAGRAAVRTGRYSEMRQIFTARLQSPPAQAALAELATTAAEIPTCLLCLEANHLHCHRACIAEALAAEHGFTIRNLPDPG
jgi:uncharacterized protein (DUF488 family)